jgi:hypothetical protein
MTIFNDNGAAENQGVWFKFQTSRFDAEKKETVFDPPADDAAEFCVRSLIPFFTERMKARKKKSEFIFNPSTRAMERVSYYPDLTPEEVQKEQEDAWDYLIIGVKNATWADGTPIECNRADKVKLMKIEQFDLFIGHCLKVLATGEKNEAEVAEKN